MLRSLKTTNKRDAEKLSRKVSVEFDTRCEEERRKLFQRKIKQECAQGTEAEWVDSAVGADGSRSAESVFSRVRELTRLAAFRVVEEQQRNPQGWLEKVNLWKDLYTSALTSPLPGSSAASAIEAQACLNGFELAIQGKPLPPELDSAMQRRTHALSDSESVTETWAALCDRALREYRHKVGRSRHKLAVSKLPEVKVAGCSELEIQDGLRVWCNARLLEVQPRTVKGQLDGMVSALRCVLPKLRAPALRELQGVMQPRVGDRQSMPIQKIRAALQQFKDRSAPATVRNDYGGGASQFDAVAVEALALLGLRPCELVQATTKSLVSKVDVFGNQGLFFRIAEGKNIASERDIPLSDDAQAVLDVEALRLMLAWQEENPRDAASARTSLGTRFKVMTSGYTLYQMRHAWKDIAVDAGVDFELRERLLGHRVRGVAAVYGSGIPLRNGMDALLQIRGAIFGEKR